jgi:alkaline phosphatase D
MGKLAWRAVALLLFASSAGSLPVPPPGAPLDTSRRPSRIAFGSCNKQHKEQPLWDQILDREPDLFAFLGDIIYADKPIFLKLRIPGDPEAVRAGYAAQLANPAYQRFRSRVPVVGVWDDHDFGTNDGDETVPAGWKRESQRALLDFLGEPADSLRRAREGAYAAYRLGRAGAADASAALQPLPSVHLILLDNRYHRSPYASTWYGTPSLPPRQDMLGEEQWAWLEKELRETTRSPSPSSSLSLTHPPLTIIGAGLQIVSRGDPWIAESWSKLPQSQARLFSLLAKYNRTRTVFISGDVHIAELHRVTCGAVLGGRVPLYDLTSSGLTHSWNGPIKRAVVGACLMGHTRVPNTTAPELNGWINERNVGAVDIKWGDDGLPTTVGLRVWGADGLLKLEHRVSREELEGTLPAGGAGSASASAASPAAVDLVSLRAAALECAGAPMDQGLTPACSAVLASCTPAVTTADSLYYFFGHAVVIGSLLSLLLLGLAAPVVAWTKGARFVPGGRPVAMALLVAGYAAAWAFIESLH